MAFSGVWPFRHVRVDEDPLITVSRSNSSSVRTLALRCRHSACDTLPALVITARTCRYTCRESRRGSIIRCMESAATTLTVRVKIMGRDARLTTHAQLLVAMLVVCCTAVEQEPSNESHQATAVERQPSKCGMHMLRPAAGPRAILVFFRNAAVLGSSATVFLRRSTLLNA